MQKSVGAQVEASWQDPETGNADGPDAPQETKWRGFGAKGKAAQCAACSQRVNESRGRECLTDIVDWVGEKSGAAEALNVSMTPVAERTSLNQDTAL